MGLDINAYSGLCFALPGSGRDENGYADYDAGYFRLSDNADFPHQASDLPREPNRSGDPDAKPSLALVCAYADRFEFRAGSYGGHGQWRERLAELSGYAPAPYPRNEARMSAAAGAWLAYAGPFYELICFSDCEGSIGPACCEKLARDFALFQPQVDALDDERFKDLYQLWRRAFELGAQGGAVCFH